MTLTKRDLVVRISEEIKKEQDLLDEAELKQDKTAHDGAGRKKSDRQKLGQQQILDVVQKALDYIVQALAKGDKVELRNFGVFEVKVRKARIGRNPNAPTTDVPIPERSVVKFKAGKEMRAQVLKLPPDQAEKEPEESAEP